jgi:SPP1 family predicted phage head-tail adaptor
MAGSSSIRAGQLQHRVQFQRQEQVQNAYGEFTASWVTVIQRWVRLVPVSGTENLHADQLDARVTHEIQMRHERIDPNYRMIYRGRVFELVSIINEDEDGFVTRILARETVEVAPTSGNDGIETQGILHDLR